MQCHSCINISKRGLNISIKMCRQWLLCHKSSHSSGLILSRMMLETWFLHNLVLTYRFDQVTPFAFTFWHCFVTRFSYWHLSWVLIYNFRYYTTCKGSRPSQFIKPKYICDGAYDCIDRNDESYCSKDAREAFIAKQWFFSERFMAAYKMGPYLKVKFIGYELG